MPVIASTLITEIRYELKDDPANPNYADDELLTYLSDASEDLIQKIAAIWPDYWLSTGQTYLDTQNIAAGVPNYNMPVQCYQIIGISVTDSLGETEFIEPLSLTRSIAEAADGYLLLNQDVYLSPEPTVGVLNGLKIYYIKRPTRMANTAADVILGDDFRGFYKGFVILKCKARQEETPALFVPLYKDLQVQLTAMMVRVNRTSDLAWKIPRPLGAWI